MTVTKKQQSKTLKYVSRNDQKTNLGISNKVLVTHVSVVQQD